MFTFDDQSKSSPPKNSTKQPDRHDKQEREKVTLALRLHVESTSIRGSNTAGAEERAQVMLNDGTRQVDGGGASSSDKETITILFQKSWIMSSPYTDKESARIQASGG